MPTADVLCLSAIAAYLRSHHGNLGPTTQYNLNQPSHTRILLGTWDSERNMTALLNPWAPDGFSSVKRAAFFFFYLIMNWSFSEKTRGQFMIAVPLFVTTWLYFSVTLDAHDEKHKTFKSTLFWLFFVFDANIYLGINWSFKISISSKHLYYTSNVKHNEKSLQVLTYHIYSFGIKERAILYWKQQIMQWF